MMSPKRTRSGNFQFEIVWKKLGIKIHRSAETKSLREYHALVDLLWQLRKNGQTDTLRAFAAGRIGIADLKQAKRSQRLQSDSLLSDLAVQQNLWAAIEECLPRMGRGLETRRRFYTSLRKLRKLAVQWLKPGRKNDAGTWVSGASVADLQKVDWKALRQLWTGSEADWNHMRRAVSSFLTVVTGDVYHPFRRSVMKRIPLEDEGTGREPDIDVDRFLEIVARTPEHAWPCYWVLALTGMRIGEYLRCTPASLDHQAHTVLVPGRKTGRSSKAKVDVDPELWDWIVIGVPSPLKHGWMRQYYKRAVAAIGQPDLMLKDLRHTHAQIASSEGVPTALIQASMRHRDPKMTRRYEMRDGKKVVAKAIAAAFKRRTG